MTVPYWRRRSSPRRVTADVCILGGGIAGLAAAHECRRRGLAAIVIERHAPGAGASGRNAGFLMRGCAENYALAIELYGRETAQRLWRLSEENLAALREFSIEQLTSYARRPSCLLALGPAEHAELERSIDLLREDGFAVEYLATHDDAAWRAGKALGGLLNPDDAVCNPHELIGLLAAPLTDIVWSGHEVYAIDERADGATVRTADVVVECHEVLCCLNAYAPLLLAELGGVIVPRRGQMLVLDAPDVRLDFAYYANRGSEYFRAAGPGRVAVGGCRTYFAEREMGYDDSTTGEVQSALERFAVDLFGQRHRVVARWSGTMGFSPDGLPLTGRVPGRQRTWLCGGFTGHGMSLAFVTARRTVAAMLDGASAPFPLDGRVAAGERASAPDGVRRG